jgi:uncharacterized protein YijF (DUF1287 family)
MNTTKTMNNDLNKIFSNMRNGEYTSVIAANGTLHIGLINSIMREDGSGKNWIVTITNQCKNEKVFIKAC